MAERRVIVVGHEDARHDFNKDGDVVDDVPQVYDIDAMAPRNLALASDAIWGVDGAVLAFAMPESAQGNQDHNQDGDTDDRLVAFFDLDTVAGNIMIDPCLRASVGGGLVYMEFESTVTQVHDRLTNAFFELRHHRSASPLSMFDRRAAYGLDELFDLNGDGDDADRILFLFDARTGQSSSSALAIWPGVFGSALALDPRFCAFLSSAAENAPGGAGAGSIPTDAVAMVEELGTGRVRSLEIPAVHLQLAGSLLALVVPEAQLGRDLNGDRDQSDWVIEVRDLKSDKTYNTGLAVRPEAAEHLAFEQRTLVILVSEEAQGRDLDDDRDLLDDVLHLVRVP